MTVELEWILTFDFNGPATGPSTSLSINPSNGYAKWALIGLLSVLLISLLSGLFMGSLNDHQWEY